MASETKLQFPEQYHNTHAGRTMRRACATITDEVNLCLLVPLKSLEVCHMIKHFFIQVLCSCIGSQRASRKAGNLPVHTSLSMEACWSK